MFENKLNWSKKLLVRKFVENVSKHFRMFWIFESFQNVSRFWIIACLFGKHFRVLCKNVYQNISTKYLPNTLECLRTIHNVLDNCQKNFVKYSWGICWETFQNVPLELFEMFLNIQKVLEQVCKHFKVSSEKIFENNSQCSG